MRFVEGYYEPTAMWCCHVCALQLSPTPSFDDAKAALQTLRSAFRTFPFADAAMVHSSGAMCLWSIYRKRRDMMSRAFSSGC
jgi:hypothetical protein